MNNKKFTPFVFALRWFCAVCTLIVLTGCSLLPPTVATGSTSTLTASGTIQANSIRLAPELSGKVAEIRVEQGDEVQAGQVMFRLDDASLQTQRKQANAALQSAQAAQAAAQANLDLLKAGATEDQLRVAQAQLDQATASRNSAQAILWEAQSNSRPEDISAAQTRLDLARQQYYHLTAALDAAQQDAAATAQDQAESNLRQMQDRHERLAQDKRAPADAIEAAATAVSDAQAVLDYAKQANSIVQDDSQLLYLQITAVRKTWEVAQLSLSQAHARQAVLQGQTNMLQEALDAAQSATDAAQKMVDQSKKAYDSLNNSRQADRLKTAFDQMQSAQSSFNALSRGSSTPTANLEALTNQLAATTAQIDAAQASYNTLKAGPRPEQISAAQAQLAAAQAKVAETQAALDAIDVQLGKLTVSTPQGGIILNRIFDPGEVIPAGAAVVELGNLDEVTLTVYVPEDQYGKVKLGQPVTVHVDSFPGRTFNGTVSRIASQAEFTPRNVQTQETRSTTVYGVEIRLPNADHALKPGMPADAGL